MEGDDSAAGSSFGPLRYVQEVKQLYRHHLDRVTPQTRGRWLGFFVLQALFLTRVIAWGGWYAICYTLYIFQLNQFLAFLTPKFDMSLQQDERNNELEAGGAPDEQSEEFRPFIRRLPEFKFWYNVTRATLLALVMSVTVWTDIPVYWPILLVYFVALFMLTMRRQIQHMMKYKYIPLDIGKKRYSAE
ncbi:protein retrieval receptor KNAG_0I01140 [Huiozyma naganishii CBS 8797]|uniref:Protein RER1 n=1 Tax=Huiozyma naganishii (strain ATCC MYA-139 / BCRC 22969 / CBS 8797 / KCTC 17520 / NBRC 10181 / NCYC 3082 / Yp74L-3) TaxID=1071383 RepID=J7RAK1_HUIN7|nr:hypothetical protein KNAG_0I01140 [Kazachstania naganishii CBS 8797]CCK71905.1 hypothetical protein KNAG_0I01140 [Kazachstania naganishii CBS 8797]